MPAMRKTDIPESVIFHDCNGQEWKMQRVITPYGFISCRCNTRVPKLTASKYQWNLWFARFVEKRENHEYMNSYTRETLEKWRNRK